MDARQALQQADYLLQLAIGKTRMAQASALAVRTYDTGEGGPTAIEIDFGVTVVLWSKRKHIEVFETLMEAATAMDATGQLRLRQHLPARQGRAKLVTKQDFEPRDRELMYMLTRGMTNKQMEARLGLRPSTVKNRLSALYAMLGAEGRVDAAVIINDTGLISQLWQEAERLDLRAV
jgi:DNA-binding NarL/FixJ family response regulator